MLESCSQAIDVNGILTLGVARLGGDQVVRTSGIESVKNNADTQRMAERTSNQQAVVSSKKESVCDI